MEADPSFAVQMHGIVKRFGAFTALDGMSLDVRRKTVHAILGENGAGKTTLMNILYGLYQADEGEVFLNGENVSDLIRTPEISMGASKVSAVPEVRAFLLGLQKDIAAKNDIIMDGRDIGTVVLPDAQVKIFLTASAEERANRRFKELQEKGDPSTYEEVLADINQRDYNDTHRDIAPLKQAEDAVLVDSSALTLEETAEEIVKVITEKTGKKKG